MKITDKRFDILTEISSVAKAKEPGSDTLIIKGLASTSAVDRAGDIVDPNAWAKGGLLNFKKNPILLFNHNFNEPIGKVIEINIVDNGLEVVGEITKAAGKYYDLIKDGVLKTFSVQFGIRDADYISETGGILIKDAELFEISVVSVPCNQDCVFSLGKSFDDQEEYKKFVETLKQAGLSDVDNHEVKASDVAKKTPEGASSEIVMNPDEIKALVQKALEDAETARKAAEEAARKEAEEVAAKEAAEKAAKEAKEKDIAATVAVAMSTGADRLVADFQKALKDDKADMGEVLKQFKDDLEKHKEDIAKIRDSKRVFPNGKDGDLSPWADDFLNAKVLGVITGKNFNTEYAKTIMAKAGVDYATSAADIDQTVSTKIEKEIRLQLRLATAFREIPVISGATVLPIQTESEPAVWQKTGAPSGNLENRGDSDSTFKAKQVTLNAYRLISSSYIDNDTEEQVLVNLMPMIIDAIAHAHARAVDHVLVNGNASISGLDDYATASGVSLDISDGDKLTADDLMAARAAMGKYGIQPRDVAYVVSMAGYYDLINDPDFQNIDEVGSDIATKVTGVVGGVFGSPVIVSDNLPAKADTASAAFAVNIRNYVIPRLRSVNLESDYEVGNQRKIIVASQSLGFEELVDGASTNQPCTKIVYAA